MALPLDTTDSPEIQTLTLSGHSKYVYSVSFSPSGEILASSSLDNTIRFWDAKSGAGIATLTGLSRPIDCVAFSPNGTILASGSWDTTIKLWDVESRSQIATLQGHTNRIPSLAFSSDGTRLVSGSHDSTIRIWDVKSGSCISELIGDNDSSWMKCTAFSPDGERFASGYDNKTIRLWEVASGTSTTLKGHSGWVTSIAISPSGKYLASGSADRTIQLWEAATGHRISTIAGHSGTIHSVAFSPNGKYLASGSLDFTIRLWDIASGSQISALRGHSGDVNSVAFSPDGNYLASGSDDKTVRIWGVENELERHSKHTTVEQQRVDSTLTIDESGIGFPSTPIQLNNDITGSISLDHSDRIGVGGFGDVYLGNYKDRGKVALKRPHRLFEEAPIRRFLREVNLWCSVSHPYVLPCLGTCKIGPDVYVVSPFIENGDLLSCMRKGKDLNRSKLLYEVAEALAHLHHNGIVHGDVKAQNILLSDNGSALLCDFGLATAFDTMETSTEVKGAGSIRWMAPELFQEGRRSMASDVYSLGITIAEVLSGRVPYQNMSGNLAVMLHVVNNDGRPAKEPMISSQGKSYVTLWETAEKCWVKDIKARPYMAEVLAMLFPLTREIAEPNLTGNRD